jgi:hypothetical protein
VNAEDEQKLSAWVDRDAIRDLIFRYSDAVTRADYEQMMTVFAPDAVWESPLLQMRFESARSFIEFQIEGSTGLDVLIQTSHNPVIELLSRDQARATTTIHEMFIGRAGGASAFGDPGTELNVDQYGIYYDEVAKIEGEWKFIHRFFAPFLLAQGGVSGDVVARRPLRPPA